jgi:hypothetical protein
MSGQAITPEARSRRIARSIGAVLSCFVVVIVLSLSTDQLFHVLNVYPPWGQPMYDARLCLVALSYRIVYTTFGCYLAARLAPYAPMRHVWVVGFIGLAIGIAGAVATIPMKLGPTWYPIMIALTALPCAWLGGVLHLRQAGR